MTNNVHRLLIVTPINRTDGVATWINNNIAAGTVPIDIGPGLSATGSAPATHNWCCASFTDIQCREILFRMCQLANVTPLTNGQWNTLTGAQKRTWYNGVRNTVFQNFGVLVMFSDNLGQWDLPDSVLTALNLKQIDG